MAKIRNLVVGCDGTWNEPEQMDDGERAPTNVVKFMNALLDEGDGRQRQHYEEGVGGTATLHGHNFSASMDLKMRSGNGTEHDLTFTVQDSVAFSGRPAGMVRSTMVNARRGPAGLRTGVHRCRSDMSAAARPAIQR